MGLFVYTLDFLYKISELARFQSQLMKVLCSSNVAQSPNLKLSYQRETPAAWPESQDPPPWSYTLPHSTSTCVQSKPKTLNLPANLSGTYPCRCHGLGSHRCRSCTPVLYGGHTGVPRGSLGSAAQRTPCSSRSRQGLNLFQGDRMGALPGIRTPPDSQLSPAGEGDTFYFTKASAGHLPAKKRSHTGTKWDKSWTHVSQITDIPEGVCGLTIAWIVSTVASPTGVSVTLSPSAWHLSGLRGWKRCSLTLHLFCLTPSVSVHAIYEHKPTKQLPVGTEITRSCQSDGQSDHSILTWLLCKALDCSQLLKTISCF